MACPLHLEDSAVPQAENPDQQLTMKQRLRIPRDNLCCFLYKSISVSHSCQLLLEPMELDKMTPAAQMTPD
jgi:hypothetical protein